MAANRAQATNERLDDTATRRVLRTFIQLALAGGFTALLTQLSKDVPASYAPYILILSTLVISAAQNYAENNGYIPPVLKTKADVAADAE